MKWIFYIIGLLLIALACKPETKPDPNVVLDYWKDYKPFSSIYNTSALQVLTEYESEGQVIDSVYSLTEVSGMSESRLNKGYAWVHNDSGNDPFLYLIRLSDAKVVLVLTSNQWYNRDWEDIECSFDKQGKAIIWLADLGDNKQNSTDLRIYKLDDIVYLASMEGDTLTVSPTEIKVAYPDSAHDIEAIFTDPIRNDLYLVTKREAKSRLYALPYKENYPHKDTLIYCGEFSFNYVTGASTSPNGKRVSIRNYQELFVWDIQPGVDFRDQLSGKPAKLPYNPQELQGESICLTDSGYYLLGEALFGIPAPLYRYKHL